MVSSEATTQIEPTSPMLLPTIYTTPTFPSNSSASSGADNFFLSSPSSWNSFNLSSILGSPQFPLTPASSPSSDYITSLFEPNSPASSMYPGLTTPISVTVILSSRSKPRERIVYRMDPEYEEALASLADECFLHQYHGVYYNIPAAVNPAVQVHFYTVTKGTHIGVFNRWYVAFSS